MTARVFTGKFRRTLCVFAVLGLALLAPVAQALVHPGILHNQADLDRIKNNIGVAPWSTAYASFAAKSTSSLTYAMRGPFATVSRNPDSNRTHFDADCQAAWDQALMWYITGNQTYANKAIAILDGWSATLTTLAGTDAALLSGDNGISLCNAAEILRYTNSGWSAAGITAFSTMMTTKFLPLVDPPGDANWGGSMLKTMISIAVFTDNTTLFNSAVNYARTSSVASITKNNLPMGMNSESGRDQPHSAGGIWNLMWVAEIAWKQGVDLYSEGNNRLLASCEHWSAYNLGNTVPVQPFGRASDGYVYTAMSATGRGTTLWPSAELTYAHYAMRKGMQVPYSLSFRDTLEAVPTEVLYFRQAGSVPSAPAAPTGVVATAAGNRAIRVTWTAVSGATGYTLVRNVVGVNWPHGDVVASGLTGTSYTDVGLAANTTHYYTVYATSATGRSSASAQVSVATSADPLWVAVSTGNPYAEPPYQADAYYTGGATGTPLAYKVIDMSAVTSPAPMRVYELLRWGTTFTYTVPGLTAGASYKVRLHFAEIAKTAAAQRKFNVTINGAAVLTNYDIFADAGTNYKAVAKEFAATADASGQIVVILPRVTDNSIIGGIEVGAVWSSADVGTVVTTGSSAFGNGVHTVLGAGSDIGGTADSLRYTYRTLTGDGTITARLASQTVGGTVNDKVGLMIRESNAANAIHASLLYDRETGTARAAARYTTGAGTSWTGTTAMTAPRWMRLQRAGTTFTASVSSDGVTWTTVGTRTVTMASSVLVGMAVCSRDTGALGTAAFDCVASP